MASHPFIVICIVLLGIVAVYSDRQEESWINRESYGDIQLNGQDFQKTLIRRVRRHDPNADKQLPGSSTTDIDESTRRREEARRIASERLERVVAAIRQHKETGEKVKRTLQGNQKDLRTLREPPNGGKLNGPKHRATNPEETEESRKAPQSEAESGKAEGPESAVFQQNIEEKSDGYQGERPEMPMPEVSRPEDRDMAEIRQNAKRESGKRQYQLKKMEREQNPELQKIFREQRYAANKRYRTKLKAAKIINSNASEVQQKTEEKFDGYQGERPEMAMPEVSRPQDRDTAEVLQKSKKEYDKCRRARLEIARQQNPQLNEKYREQCCASNRRRAAKRKEMKLQNPKQYETYREKCLASNRRRTAKLQEMKLQNTTVYETYQKRCRAANERYIAKIKATKFQNPDFYKAYRSRHNARQKRYKAKLKAAKLETESTTVKI